MTIPKIILSDITPNESPVNIVLRDFMVTSKGDVTVLSRLNVNVECHGYSLIGDNIRLAIEKILEPTTTTEVPTTTAAPTTSTTSGPTTAPPSIEIDFSYSYPGNKGLLYYYNWPELEDVNFYAEIPEGHVVTAWMWIESRIGSMLVFQFQLQVQMLF